MTQIRISSCRLPSILLLASSPSGSFGLVVPQSRRAMANTMPKGFLSILLASDLSKDPAQLSSLQDTNNRNDESQLSSQENKAAQQKMKQQKEQRERERIARETKARLAAGRIGTI